MVCPLHRRQDRIFISCHGVVEGNHDSAAPTVKKTCRVSNISTAKQRWQPCRMDKNQKSPVQLDILRTYLHANVLCFHETRLLPLFYCLMLTFIRFLLPLIPPLKLSSGWKKTKPPEAKNKTASDKGCPV